MNLSKYFATFGFTIMLTLAAPALLRAQSQGEMNLRAEHDFEAADAKLNKIYKQLMGEIDQPAQAKLKASQLAWIAFRDAEATVEADFLARGGTMAPTIYNGCRTDLTAARTTTLEKLKHDYSN